MFYSILPIYLTMSYCPTNQSHLVVLPHVSVAGPVAPIGELALSLGHSFPPVTRVRVTICPIKGRPSK